jgi:hypothetical protein
VRESSSTRRFSSPSVLSWPPDYVDRRPGGQRASPASPSRATPSSSPTSWSASRFIFDRSHADRLNSRSYRRGSRSRAAAGPNNKGIDRGTGNVGSRQRREDPGDADYRLRQREGCFLAWHGKKGRSRAALIEPVQGSARVRCGESGSPKKGTHPPGVGPTGAVAIVYFEAGRVKTALPRVTASEPRASWPAVTGDQLRPGSPARSWWQGRVARRLARFP